MVKRQAHLNDENLPASVFPSQTSKTDMIDVLQPLKIEYCHTSSTFKYKS